MELFKKIKPNNLIGICLILQIALTVLGNIFDWRKIIGAPVFVYIGIAIAVTGYSIHLISHRSHNKAHQTSQVINEIVTEGLFSKIRHPMYLGMTLFFWGGYLAWSYLAALAIPILATVLMVLLAKSEEKFLTEKLGREYLDYKAKVKWMFIPYLF